MEVMKVSPESFYKESVKNKYRETAETAAYLENSGADIIDIRLIRNSEVSRRLGRPIMIGVSGRFFLGVLTDKE